MKKSLLLLSAFAIAITSLATSQARFSISPSSLKLEKTAVKKITAKANESDPFVRFEYASDPSQVYQLNNLSTKNYVYIAFEMTQEAQIPYIGNEISSVYITTGSSDANKNLITRIYAFAVNNFGSSFTDDATPFTLTTSPLTEVEIPLNNPIEIDGKKSIYVGFFFRLSNLNASYIVSDEIPVNKPSCLLGVTDGLTETPVLSNYADQIGSACIACKITGNNLPVDYAQISSLDLPPYIEFNNGKISYPISIKNLGSNNIDAVTMLTEISNGSSSENTVTLTDPIEPGKTAEIIITDVSDLAAGVDHLSATLKKVNGVENEEPKTYESVLAAFGEGYKRYPVIEKATGIGCGYCPRGIVSFDCIAKNYPDWILIAIHDNWFGPDPMTISEYNAMITSYFNSNPEAITNRKIPTPLVGDDVEGYKAIYEYFASNPAYADVDVEGVVNQEDKTITVEASVEVATAVNIKHELSFVIVEDNLGPYLQHNYFANNAFGYMWGWESCPEYQPTIYDDVARMLKGYPGITRSLPATLQPGENYKYSTDLSLANVSQSDFRVIALITNTETNEIVNAKQFEFKWVGIENVEADLSDIVISVINGNINVIGAQNVNVFSTSGLSVGTTNLPAGIYIVVADGVTRKVLVK